ncbi:major facilitator super transporter protein [Aspergillus nanangensis]|uniref:GPI ethanolamine phosphate transferase 2 n=1 Tax=Aspergillus nanangensis TaxID=2582783 RepID=A0AAD4CT40_ASPNN|nr:major facilitator super transporter protein [Aspergillus nanangensis]
MPTISGSWAILLANFLIPIAVLVFSSGFFPYKPLLPGIATFQEPRNGIAPPKVFDRLIFMVVDALRSDFVYSNNSGFEFTQSLIRSGGALPFTAHASSPTVTMPRLKAITTGSVPSFLDVILNIAESDTSSTLAHQDTWLAQIKAKGDQLIMYGDDTWLKLFPNVFTRSEGTTSFFVSDFTEVDNNVTRHVPGELTQSDWSAFIMHYLGLDHIGHKSGPRSPHMIKKQEEMDSIVFQVYSALEQEAHLESTLFVLCGDHGMNDAGNHGGSSVGETSAALLFISPKFQAKGVGNESPIEALDDLQYYTTVDQTDITPTLAGLLGLPIPLNSLGIFIPQLLDLWETESQKVHFLLQNSQQLLKIVKEAFPNYDFEPSLLPAASCTPEPSGGIEGVQCAWFHVLEYLRGNDEALTSSEPGPELEAHLLLFLGRAQELMSNAASNYNVMRLYLGICISIIAVWLSSPATYSLSSKTRYAGTFLLFNILGYSGIMFASSYVEEEQQFWYWMVTGWVFYLHARCSGHLYGNCPQMSNSNTGHRSGASLYYIFGAVGLAIANRMLRRWNQTGQKFAAEPDISQGFFPFHQDILWALVCLTYVATYLHFHFHGPISLTWRVSSFLVTTTAFLFKIMFVSADSPELLDKSFLRSIANRAGGMPLVSLARVTFAGILMLIVFSIYKKRQGVPLARKVPGKVFHEALTLLLMTESRVTNIPLFLIFKFQANILAAMDTTAIELTISSLLFQYMTFFAFGGSNSISSVDLSNAYNGIGSYSVVFVGILTYMSNWAGPIWWVSASHILRSKSNTEGSHVHFTIQTFHMAAVTTSVMAACTALRTHLFIWTVFSPKYLYTVAWAVLNHLGVNTLSEVGILLMNRK